MLEGILDALNIRLVQILTQLVGFLLVFGLLSKLLWQPILNLMDSREKEVSDNLKSAEQAKADSEKMKSDLKQRLDQAEGEAQQKVAEGVKKGNELAEQIVAEARQQADDEKQKALRSIRDEASKAKAELRDLTVGLSLDVASKILDEKVDKQKHEEMVKKFLNELESTN